MLTKRRGGGKINRSCLLRKKDGKWAGTKQRGTRLSCFMIPVCRNRLNTYRWALCVNAPSASQLLWDEMRDEGKSVPNPALSLFYPCSCSAEHSPALWIWILRCREQMLEQGMVGHGSIGEALTPLAEAESRGNTCAASRRK